MKALGISEASIWPVLVALVLVGVFLGALWLRHLSPRSMTRYEDRLYAAGIFDESLVRRLHAEFATIAQQGSRPSLDNVVSIEEHYAEALALGVTGVNDDKVGPLLSRYRMWIPLVRYWLGLRFKLAREKPEWAEPLPRLIRHSSPGAKVEIGFQ